MILPCLYQHVHTFSSVDPQQISRGYTQTVDAMYTDKVFIPF